jgi:hypothetical protein
LRQSISTLSKQAEILGSSNAAQQIRTVIAKLGSIVKLLVTTQQSVADIQKKFDGYYEDYLRIQSVFDSSDRGGVEKVAECERTLEALHRQLTSFLAPATLDADKKELVAKIKVLKKQIGRYLLLEKESLMVKDWLADVRQFVANFPKLEGMSEEVLFTDDFATCLAKWKTLKISDTYPDRPEILQAVSTLMDRLSVTKKKSMAEQQARFEELLSGYPTINDLQDSLSKVFSGPSVKSVTYDQVKKLVIELPSFITAVNSRFTEIESWTGYKRGVLISFLRNISLPDACDRLVSLGLTLTEKDPVNFYALCRLPNWIEVLSHCKTQQKAKVAHRYLQGCYTLEITPIQRLHQVILNDIVEQGTQLSDALTPLQSLEFAFFCYAYLPENSFPSASLVSKAFHDKENARQMAECILANFSLLPPSEKVKVRDFYLKNLSLILTVPPITDEMAVPLLRFYFDILHYLNPPKESMLDAVSKLKKAVFASKAFSPFKKEIELAFILLEQIDRLQVEDLKRLVIGLNEHLRWTNPLRPELGLRYLRRLVDQAKVNELSFTKAEGVLIHSSAEKTMADVVSRPEILETFLHFSPEIFKAIMSAQVIKTHLISRLAPQAQKRLEQLAYDIQGVNLLNCTLISQSTVDENPGAYFSTYLYNIFEHAYRLLSHNPILGQNISILPYVLNLSALFCLCPIDTEMGNTPEEIAVYWKSLYLDSANSLIGRLQSISLDDCAQNSLWHAIIVIHLTFLRHFSNKISQDDPEVKTMVTAVAHLTRRFSSIVTTQTKELYGLLDQLTDQIQTSNDGREAIMIRLFKDELKAILKLLKKSIRGQVPQIAPVSRPPRLCSHQLNLLCNEVLQKSSLTQQDIDIFVTKITVDSTLRFMLAHDCPDSFFSVLMRIVQYYTDKRDLSIIPILDRLSDCRTYLPDEMMTLYDVQGKNPIFDTLVEVGGPLFRLTCDETLPDLFNLGVYNDPLRAAVLKALEETVVGFIRDGKKSPMLECLLSRFEGWHKILESIYTALQYPLSGTLAGGVLQLDPICRTMPDGSRHPVAMRFFLQQLIENIGTVQHLRGNIAANWIIIGHGRKESRTVGEGSFPTILYRSPNFTFDDFRMFMENIRPTLLADGTLFNRIRQFFTILNIKLPPKYLTR